MSEDADAVRVASFFRDVIDPGVRGIITADDPWDAYNEAARMRGAMLDHVEWGPHGGQIFIAWADLEDLHVTGKTSIEDAHAALGRAARDWLARPAGGLEMAAYLEEWTVRVARRCRPPSSETAASRVHLRSATQRRPYLALLPVRLAKAGGHCAAAAALSVLNLLRSVDQRARG